MKLVVMIPAYNEEETLPRVIMEIPKKIEGVDIIEILVIDDGSTDRTVEVARRAGAIVIKNKKNYGLAHTFRNGLEFALQMNADIIVNIDADGQYNALEIPRLIKPIMENKADLVNGDRQVSKLAHMPLTKKYGNILGTRVVAWLSGIKKLRDASSGFRAYNKESALRFFIMSNHTYTHETLIQAGNSNLRVCEIPVEFHPRGGGKSRLISGVFLHIKKSLATIVRTKLMYDSLKFLSYIGAVFILVSLFLFGRYLYYNANGVGGAHIQSLLLGTILIVIGFLIIVLGLIADLISINRKYHQEILYRLRKHGLEKHN